MKTKPLELGIDEIGARKIIKQVIDWIALPTDKQSVENCPRIQITLLAQFTETLLDRDAMD